MPLSFTDDEELASYFVKMADMGFGLSRDDTAFRIAEGFGWKHPFVKDCAGRSWLKMHLAVRSAQSLSHACTASANDEIIRDYFTKLGAACARLNITGYGSTLYI